jgi:hypothetical protein
MNQESIKLSAESRDIHLQTQKLTTATITLNTEIRKLNEESTEAARANQAAAAKTSLSTRVNVEVKLSSKPRLDGALLMKSKLLLLTTPFGMVLQYFGSEKDIFSFTRNAKTFVFATLILMAVLRLLTVVLEHSGKLMNMLPWKHTFRSRQQHPLATNRGVCV